MPSVTLDLSQEAIEEIKKKYGSEVLNQDSKVKVPPALETALRDQTIKEDQAIGAKVYLYKTEWRSLLFICGEMIARGHKEYNSISMAIARLIQTKRRSIDKANEKAARKEETAAEEPEDEETETKPQRRDEEETQPKKLFYSPDEDEDL